jgi:hypothetical protein
MVNFSNYFCQRLSRPECVISLKTGCWNSKSIYSGCQNRLQTKYSLHIFICQSQFIKYVSIWDTLYLPFLSEIGTMKLLNGHLSIFKKYLNLQGISYWNVFYELTLTDKNMQAIFCLKVILTSWDYGFWVLATSFWRNDTFWPQQPLTEKIAKIHHDISWFYQKKSYSKDQNKAEFNNLDNF